MARTAILGLGRIGPDRELKFALEAFWAGRCDEDQLAEVARGLRASGWEKAWRAGIDVIPSGDFSLYDHVLDTAWALGAIPERFGEVDRQDLRAYFGLARGTESQRPLEMTKWFDTNYHYLVPELRRGQAFMPRPPTGRDRFGNPRRGDPSTRPVVLGPFSFLLLSKGWNGRSTLSTTWLPAYRQLLRRAGAPVRPGPDRRTVPRPRPHRPRAGRVRGRRAAALHSAAAVELCLATYFAG